MSATIDNQDNDSEEGLGDTKLGVIPSSAPFALIAVGIILAGLWMLEPVRGLLVEEMASRDARLAVAALQDPSSDIAVTACDTLMERDIPFFVEDDLEDALFGRPGVAVRCLKKHVETKASSQNESGKEQAKPDSEKGSKNAEKDDGSDDAKSADSNPIEEASGQLNRPALMARAVGRRWLDALESGKTEQCALATKAGWALSVSKDYPNYKLLRCGLTSGSQKSRSCCLKAMGGRDEVAERLFDITLPPERKLTDDVEGFVRASFPDQYNTHAKQEADEKDTTAKDQKQSASQEEASTASMTKAVSPFEGKQQTRLQDWSVDVACYVHFNAPEERQAISAFVPVIESEGCSPGEEPWLGYYEPATWSALCGGLYDQAREMGSKSPKDAVCSVLKHVTVADAIFQASTALKSSMAVAGQRGLVKEDTQIAAPGVTGRRRSGGSLGAARRLQNHSKNSRMIRSLSGAIMGF